MEMAFRVPALVTLCMSSSGGIRVVTSPAPGGLPFWPLRGTALRRPGKDGSGTPLLYPRTRRPRTNSRGRGWGCSGRVANHGYHAEIAVGSDVQRCWWKRSGHPSRCSGRSQFGSCRSISEVLRHAVGQGFAFLALPHALDAADETRERLRICVVRRSSLTIAGRRRGILSLSGRCFMFLVPPFPLAINTILLPYFLPSLLVWTARSCLSCVTLGPGRRLYLRPPLMGASLPRGVWAGSCPLRVPVLS